MKLLLAAAISALALQPSSANAKSSMAIVSNLEDVFANPMNFAGREFEGYAYISFDDSPYAFYPRKVRSAADQETFGTDLLPGTGSQDLSEVSELRSGDRLLIRGIIDPDKVCWVTHTCVPFSHPIMLKKLRVLAIEHSVGKREQPK